MAGIGFPTQFCTRVRCRRDAFSWKLFYEADRPARKEEERMGMWEQGGGKTDTLDVIQFLEYHSVLLTDL